MDLRLLEYFLSVAKTGNITRAAEQLHVTQPTISRQLIELEQEMGTRLLIRGKRQITLTDAGILFQQRAEEIVSLLQKTARDIADQDDLLGGTVAVGCVESCASMLRPPSSAPMCRTSWHWYDAGMSECVNNIVKTAAENNLRQFYVSD